MADNGKESEEDKERGFKELPPPEKYKISKEGLLTIEVELFRINPMTALGFLLIMQDVVKSWYTERMKDAQKQRTKLTVPGGAMGSLRNFLGRKH